jgi:predicted RND superfamily exporter protein
VRHPKRSPLQTLWQWAAAALCAVLGLIVFRFVDLDPEVQADFFFSTDDPQLQSSLEIAREFGDSEQVLVAVRGRRIVSKDYLLRLRALTDDLLRVEGVADARSLTHGPEKPDEIPERDAEEVFEDLSRSPFWRRLVLAPDGSPTFILLDLKGDDHSATVAAIDDVAARHAARGLEIHVSGVPYVSEHVRGQLTSDLRRFSVAAFAAFAVVVGVLFRSLAVLLGTMVSALTACFATFIVRSVFGMPTDVLAPNLWVIAFVLTLSHVVYLTAQWRKQVREARGVDAVWEAVRLTAPASAWSLAANLLGFASLLFVSARPLQQFGISGGIAAVLAMACTYALYPPFLRAADAGAKRESSLLPRLDGFIAARHPWIAAAVLAAGIALAPFAWRVDTDPSVPSYFEADGRIRTGLEAVDRAGGSSPLDIVVKDAGGRRFDDDDVVKRLQLVQRRLERHPDVGSVLSVALLMEEAHRPWYSVLVPWEWIFERLESPKWERVGRTFVSEDRRRGRFILRMKELERTRPRNQVIGELRSVVHKAGFVPVNVGGLYPLAYEMSELVEASVIRGLGGLLALFFVIVLIVTRSLRNALSMVLCLALTPFLLFGLVGLRGMPIDIISAPAANVALPLGIDEMIHLGYRLRRQGKGGGLWSAWSSALTELWRPIFASMLIVVSGFGLFLLSSFPPTQRLGMLVCLGTIMTDLVVLLVLPAVATWGWRRRHLAGNRGQGSVPAARRVHG